MRSFTQEPQGSLRRLSAPPFPDDPQDVVLAAGTLLRYAIPTGARVVTFAFDGNVRVKLGVVTTALALPTATTTDGSGSELNPATRAIPPFLGDGTTVPTHICLIAPAACAGSLTFFKE